MTQYVGLDVSLKETKLHVLDEAGSSRLKRLLTSDARLDNEANFVRNGPALVGVQTIPRSNRRQPVVLVSRNALAFCNQAARGRTSRAIASPLSIRAFVRSCIACRFIQNSGLVP